VVVADLWGGRVQAFDRDGRPLAHWALDGLPFGERDRVTGLAATPQGQVVVAGGDASLAWHDLQGRVVGRFDLPRLADGGRRQPGAVAVDDQGAVYLIDRAARAVLKLRLDAA
jgi:hypothetical protein